MRGEIWIDGKGGMNTNLVLGSEEGRREGETARGQMVKRTQCPDRRSDHCAGYTKHAL